MEYYQIEGGVPLQGEYRVKGAKNAALPILAATICKGGVHEIYDCPRIGDALILTRILEQLGAGVSWEKDCLIIDSRSLTGNAVPKELMEKLRSSVFLLGSLLARTGEATVYRPGGCKIGKRPIDIHINGLRELGFEILEDEEKVTCRGKCRGGRFHLSYPSVGATENLMMAALSGESQTILENCATEPEIIDLQGFLRSCGFGVYGAGTSRIFIEGSRGKNDSMYFIMEDRIEAATYLMAIAGTGGEGILTNIRPELLEEVLTVLVRMGVPLRKYGDRIWVKKPDDGLGRTALKSPGILMTAPYPGFPTDCQPQLLTLATKAKGLTTIREEIFDSRFTHKKDLMKMGANIEICGKNAIIKGTDVLYGRSVSARDLRGGAALVLAGLMAEGITRVEDIYHIERGYEDFPQGISQLGGLIETKNERETKEKSESIGEIAGIDFTDGSHICRAVPSCI
ncbi:MAG: UDP-N-acetylglucosamine 1-carboxyvinyltransferase [Firmicutes bacterium]|nr:UDP-N-acetylglucosamine 1-carboxyvinyltransferase [Bacillota bacterium]